MKALILEDNASAVLSFSTALMKEGFVPSFDIPPRPTEPKNVPYDVLKAHREAVYKTGEALSARLQKEVCIFTRGNHTVQFMASCKLAQQAITTDVFDVYVFDMLLPDGDSVEMSVAAIKLPHPHEVVLTSSNWKLQMDLVNKALYKEANFAELQRRPTIYEKKEFEAVIWMMDDIMDRDDGITPEMREEMARQAYLAEQAKPR